MSEEKRASSGMFFRDMPGRDQGNFHKEAAFSYGPGEIPRGGGMNVGTPNAHMGTGKGVKERKDKGKPCPTEGAEKKSSVTPSDWNMEEYMPRGRHRPTTTQPQALEAGGQRFHSEESRMRDTEAKTAADLRFLGTSFNKTARSMNFTSAREYLGDAAGDAGDYLRDIGRDAKDTLGQAGDAAVRGVDRGVRSAAKNPLAVGLGAAALGGLGIRGLRGAGRVIGRGLGRKPPPTMMQRARRLISG